MASATREAVSASAAEGEVQEVSAAYQDIAEAHAAGKPGGELAVLDFKQALLEAAKKEKGAPRGRAWAWTWSSWRPCAGEQGVEPAVSSVALSEGRGPPAHVGDARCGLLCPSMYAS